jgi:replication-associated recombination protein RarA
MPPLRKKWVDYQLARIERVRANLPKHATHYPEAYNAYLDACASLVKGVAESNYDTAITCLARAWTAGQDSIEEEKKRACEDS